MSTDSSIFNSGNPTDSSTTAGANANNSNPLETLLAGIKNESGAQKYASVEEALKGAAHAQDYIAQLKREKDEADRQAQEARRIAEESKGQLSEQETLKRSIQELTQKYAEQSSNSGTALTPEQIAELVNRTLSQKETASKAQANVASVIDAMKAKFGDKAEEVFLNTANDLGLTVAEMNDLAAKSPKVILKSVGVSGVQANQPSHIAPGSSVLNTAAFTPKQDSQIKRNSQLTSVGATTQDVMNEAKNARNMVDEVHAAGYTMYDLSDPKVYRKLFTS